MSKIDNLKAVTSDFDVPVVALIDFVTGYSEDKTTPEQADTRELLDSRVAVSEELNLGKDYINGLKDAKKLLT